ncbi:uncharacterized protein LOC114364679 isoform X2 [Ostrinia furnacalis]|uniref:uncharacterized protein LOC114364679 isoform X1 n=1 Tax=Ostrinia furnacalis TaxID=93504 RepID=UPI00103E1CDE|nr:uncharacterized protein LOC114364679 isoform X1 [Ostrinia furnacalis]XP_028176713.1 uncharacterized protein LOC114364679 isoform X2 [Ostrinia furnacalis]
MDDDRDDESHENIKKSGVWKHFEIANDRDRTATCNICFKLLSYRTSITNLKKHLARKHGDDEDMLSKISDDEGETIEELETYLEDAGSETDTKKGSEIYKKPYERSKSSAVWEHFTVKDNVKKIATCKVCDHTLSYLSTTSNLKKHWSNKHCVQKERVTRVVDDDETDCENSGTVTENVKDGRRRKTSIAWKYFTVQDSDRCIAKCKQCDKSVSYFSSVSNLMKHIDNKHHGKKRKLSSEAQGKNSETETRKKIRTEKRKSIAWKYFTIKDHASKIATCTLCGKSMSYSSVSNLMKHVQNVHRKHNISDGRKNDNDDSENNAEKHPGVKLKDMHDGKKMLIASDGQLYEIEDETKVETLEIDDDNNDDDDHQSEEPIELNAIYLDDYEGTVIEPNRKRKPSTSKRKRLIAENNDSSEGELTYQKQYSKKTSDSLDQFGKYLVSLLRQLPKELSNQLQADFVKQVMTSQLTYQSQNVVVAPSNGYSITITEAVPKGNNDAYISTEGNDVSQSQ